MASPRRPSSGRVLIGKKKKIGLVCSGGATKAGAFHLGVALALQEQGFRFRGGLIPPDGPPPPEPMEISTYVGSSAGSIISTYLAAGFTLENIFNSFLGREPTDEKDSYPKPLPRLTYPMLFRLRPGLAREQVNQIFHFKRLLTALLKGDFGVLSQMKWIKATGLFTTEGLEQYLREQVLESNRFQDYSADLFITATQLNHSRKVVFGKYSYQPPPHDLNCQYDNDVAISQACAASTALPFVYAPYSIKNQQGRELAYIDGEIRDTLSTHVAIDAGCDLVIASYTHQPYHLLKEVGSLTEVGLPAILIQSIYLLIEQKINNHIHNKEIQKNAINAVLRYCKQESLSPEMTQRICEILEAELHHRLDVDSIYIHPNPTDTAMFFGDHFSLSPTRMSEYVKSGFRAAIDVLRKFDFEDRTEKEPVIRTEAAG
jgi:predicted acylesterase/phospholipase RssA